ncbi:MAG: trigger factor [bacterium]
MKVSVEKQDNNVFQLDIEIDAEIASQEYNKACRKIGERIVVPGFRKGKAPRSMIEKHFGISKIQKEALDRLLPNILADTISEHQLDLASEPIIEKYNFELGEPLKLTAKLEVKPEVTLNGYKGLIVEVPEFKHPENAMEQELKNLTERFATLEPIINRPIKESDIVIIDYAGTVNGELIKGGSAKNHQLNISNNNFIKGFSEQLVGKNLGEDFMIKVTFPSNYFDSALAGKEACFQIKINEIKEKIVPEINDELAQRVGAFQTIEELKADLVSYLKKTKEIENKVRTEKAVLNKTIDKASVDIPDSMINKEAKVLLEEVQAKLKSQGVSWEQVLDSQGHENIWNSLREEAAKRVKSSLVLGTIAKIENIQLADEDFINQAREFATIYNTDEKSVFRQISQTPGLAQSLSQQIMSQKIIQFLLENNEVKYIEDSSEYVEEIPESEF